MAINSSNTPVDSTGNAFTSQVNGSQQALDVGVNVAGVQVDPRSIRALTSGTDTVAVNGISGTVSLPTGAATAANQATEIASLASIDSKLTSPIAVTTNTAVGAFTDHSLSLGTTSTSVVPANASRKYLLIQNNGSKSIWINFGIAANTSQPSVQLVLGGGSFLMEGSLVNNQEIFAIAVQASTPVTIKEA